MRLFNTLTRKKEDFEPIGKEVKFYACGPTVYNYAHIGNLRTYVFNDILRRALVYSGFNVTQVMNITDVGHLTSDADEGEDKMEKGAKREGKTVWEVAEFYTEAFKQDMKKLNIAEPDKWCKATDHIDLMIEMIKSLEKNGFTYNAGGNVYYDTSKFKHYPELAKLKLENLEEGARTDKDPNKKNPSDFVLWFTLEGSKYGKDHAMKWESPWGTGFPGWHIECSAMSSKYLGEQFDIHTGGIDHINVHHTNEIAQAEGCFGKNPWVKYWLHGNFLVLDKEKMAKSGENFLTLSLLEDKGFDAMAYRYFCLSAHYRSELRFSIEAMEGAQNSYHRLKNKVIEMKTNPQDGSGDNKEFLAKFKEAIQDDLNVPVALAVIWEMLDSKLSDEKKYETMVEFDEVLGLDIVGMKADEVPKEIQVLVEKREAARTAKDFETSDKIRDELKEKGWAIEDTPQGPRAKKV
ncbi:cysteine--tRNA ligase [Nanoarchaeota archaeon]